MRATDRRISLGTPCLLACSVLLALSSSGADENRTRWLHFEPAVVELTGVVGVAYEYGAPKWGDGPEGDEPHPTTILRLSKPINIVGDPTSDLDQGDAENVEEVRLQPYRYGGLVGKRVIARGTLKRSHIGWHFSEVVLTVKSIRKAPRLKSRPVGRP
jgi:hypothetical protein